MIVKKRRIKSRKKLTHEQALQGISSLMAEYQTEKEMYVALNGKIDKTMRLIFSMTGIDDIEKAKRQREENLDYITWKMEEDLGRFVEVGTHELGLAYYTFTKF